MTRRFVIATMRHETNTFSPIATNLEHFVRGSSDGKPMAGDTAIEALTGTNSSFAGYYDLLKGLDAEIIVPFAGHAWPQGTVTASAFEDMVSRILADVEKGCDALFLDLHGAMVTDNHDDAEGELLNRIRAIAPELPVALSLDFHANMSAALMNNVTTIAGYRTYPHVDTYETGQRAGKTLLRAMAGEVSPVVSWGVLPMLTHMLKQTPALQPMKDIMDRAIRAEADGEVLNASIFGGFPLADIPHVGLAAVIVTDGDKVTGDALRDALLDMAWERRANFVFEIEPMAESITGAKSMQGRPIVLADHGDNCGAGGVTDIMAVLEEVLRQGLEDVCAGPFCDPDAVQSMIAAGEGAYIDLALGGKWDMPALALKGRPLTLSGKVSKITDGSFQVSGPMSTGVTMHLGPTAVLDLGSVQVVVSSRPVEPVDVGCFAHAGIDPTKKKFVLIKSRQHFRAGFEPIAKAIVMVAGPGVCSSDYDIFPFKNIPRPIYPLDLDTPKTMIGN